MTTLADPRDGFAAALEEAAAADPRIVVLTNDSVGSSKVGPFGERFPGRLINVGIAEQNLVGIAAGLANGGKLPVVCAAACFLTARALEQIKVDVAYTGANVKLCGMSAGLAYGALGATHHAIEDLAWLRAIAGLALVVPADLEETHQALHAALAWQGPVYLRLSRTPVPALPAVRSRFTLGAASLLREGDDITLVACGTMVHQALGAAALLAQDGVAARVLNLATLAPLDETALECAAAETGGIVTVEEHSTRGGLGGAVAEALARTRPAPMRLLGVPGVFAPTGPTPWLLEHFGLTPAGIRAAALDLLAKGANRGS